MIPALIAEAVSCPRAVSGLAKSSILGSRDVPLKRASAERSKPGAMEPPRYSPFDDTQSKVVAVP